MGKSLFKCIVHGKICSNLPIEQCLLVSHTASHTASYTASNTVALICFGNPACKLSR